MAKETESSPIVHMVRADGGVYAEAFKKGGYAGIGWFEDVDLSPMIAQEDKEGLKEWLREQYRARHTGASNLSVGQNVGIIWRFLVEVVPGTYVGTPTEDSSKLMVGQVTGDYYFEPNPTDSPYPHRRPVKWFDKLLSRNTLSVPAQNTSRSTLTVFNMPQVEEILVPFDVPIPPKKEQAAVTEKALKELVLNRILELKADQFGILVTELLTAIGFEAEHVDRVGDEGIDVTGTLQVYDFAKLDLKVQVKRYKLSARISRRNIKDFRGSLPEKSEAAFVTTADFARTAREEAEKPGFKKIGLINGTQLVDILVEHYEALSPEMREELKFGRTLIPLV